MISLRRKPKTVKVSSEDAIRNISVMIAILHQERADLFARNPTWLQGANSPEFWLEYAEELISEIPWLAEYVNFEPVRTAR